MDTFMTGILNKKQYRKYTGSQNSELPKSILFPNIALIILLPNAL